MTTALCLSLVKQDDVVEARGSILMLKLRRACWFPRNFHIDATEPKHVIKLSRMEFKYKSCLNRDEEETCGRPPACTMAWQGWESCCSWTFKVSLKEKKKKQSYKTLVCLQPVAARSLRSPSLLQNKTLCQKVNCMLTTLSHRKDRNAFSELDLHCQYPIVHKTPRQKCTKEPIKQRSDSFLLL